MAKESEGFCVSPVSSVDYIKHRMAQQIKAGNTKITFMNVDKDKAGAIAQELSKFGYNTIIKKHAITISLPKTVTAADEFSKFNVEK